MEDIYIELGDEIIVEDSPREVIEVEAEEVPQELTDVVAKSGLEIADQDQIKISYAPYFKELKEIKAEEIEKIKNG